jgi:hypothetical protein
MNKKIRADFIQAMELLDDDKLEWSKDMESIRKALADVFDEACLLGLDSLGTLNYLAEVLIADENDLTAH